MAKIAKKNLLSEIDEYSKNIENITTWKGTKKPFGHIKQNTKENYIYEFWCYLKILSEIHKQPNQIVKLVFASGKFPTAPASKKGNWSYYIVTNSNNEIISIVCAGTGIKRPDAPETIHHPDISFQKAKADTTDDPLGTDVDIILDAKFVYPKSKNGQPKKIGKIKLSILNEFGHLVEVLLRNRKSKKTLLNFGKLNDLNSNALLSNAYVQKKHANACKIDCFKQIGEFEIGDNFKVIG